MKLNSVTKKINKTEKVMGFVNFAKENSKIFPNTKRKIIINSLSFKESFLCTYDPKYNRIYGLRKLFLKNFKKNNFTIKLLKNNTYNVVFN